jgi:hypothetical protein
MDKGLIHYILLFLEDASEYYRIARQLCKYTRKEMGNHVYVKCVKITSVGRLGIDTYRWRAVWRDEISPDSVAIVETLLRSLWNQYECQEIFNVNGTLCVIRKVWTHMLSVKDYILDPYGTFQRIIRISGGYVWLANGLKLPSDGREVTCIVTL